MFTSTNPTTGEVFASYPELDEPDIEAALARSAAAFTSWRRVPVAARAQLLARAAEILDGDKAKLGRLMTLEMGKTLKSAIGEVEKCAWVCRHYAEHAVGLLSDEPVAMDGGRVRHLPLGAVLAIMPWNFPFWQVFRFAAPALVAGNVGLLKHAANVPGCALAIAEIFARAGLPVGVFQSLLIGPEAAGRVLADPRVHAVTLTGSEAAGAAVAAQAGKLLKKSLLELGGSDPFVVMPSADLDEAARVAVVARHINNGQSCIAAKRFIVHRDVYEAFTRRFADGVARLRVGDPLADDTDVGPLASRAAVTGLARQVDASIAAGARVVVRGAGGPAGAGFFYPPTVLADIPRAAPVYHEEVFGPVALLFRADDLDHAIRLANDSPYGLGSSVWTRDPVERDRFIDEIEAGLTFVNTMVVSDPRLPFGGVKRSGYGRELGVHGLREFVNLKGVVEK